MFQMLWTKLLRRQSDTVFQAPPLSRIDTASMEKIFARLFAGEDGRKALAYLQTITFMRAASMDVPESNLRYIEGQRALMATILRLIERGRTNPQTLQEKGDM